MAQIHLLISDFDGTLVNTFYANFEAYRRSFDDCGLNLTEEEYLKCFGLRFDDFMNALNITDNEVKFRIRNLKSLYYPNYFKQLIVNVPLLSFLRSFKVSGGITALASTARKINLMNAVNFIGAEDAFNYISAGEDVLHGKPNPEIYNNILTRFDVKPEETLVFEDSDVGINAAVNAGINYIRIDNTYFDGIKS